MSIWKINDGSRYYNQENQRVITNKDDEEKNEEWYYKIKLKKGRLIEHRDF